MTDLDKLILIGRVAGAHGVRGEVRITAYGDDPMALVGYRDLKRQDGRPLLTVVSGRAAKGALIARTKELSNKDAADALRGVEAYVPRSVLPEPDEDEFYLTDLIGLEARAPDGESLGKVINVEDFGAGDILEIRPVKGSSWFLAFTKDVVPEISISDGWLQVIRPEEIEVNSEDGHDEQTADGIEEV